MSPYPHLLSPVALGPLRLKNRVVMGSLHTRLENEPDAGPLLVAFYAARARGGVGLIVTGGTSPNHEGRIEEGAQVLDSPAQLAEHRCVTEAVHAAGGRIVMQILHTGIYAKHDDLVGPTEQRSPINRRTPRALTAREIERTIDDFGRCAALAREAGYDGVELMGSEGYLITQFLASRTNTRTDEWGGPFAQRMRFAVEIVRRIRARVGPDFALLFRISAIDLVEGGLTGDEVDALARALEAAGVDALSCGIGWHEAAVPTIATCVPRAAFAFAAVRLKRVVRIPVIASNRINTPEVAEAVLARGDADLVSMARTFLADPDFVNKAAQGRADEINTCIGCNQACLDRIFAQQRASCLVNPRACHETEFDDAPAARPLRVAVVGAGAAGMACAATAAERGHRVTLFEAEDEVGGQLILASRIPGKTQEFGELLRYFRVRLSRSGAEVRTGQAVDADTLAAGGFDHVVLATGVRARGLDCAGAEHPRVVGYAQAIREPQALGARVAIIGTGGIGHDVAELLTALDGAGTAAAASVGPRQAPAALQAGEASEAEAFFAEWGVDPSIAGAGGWSPPSGAQPSARQVTLLQRSHARPGERLARSTGWIHRLRLVRRGVQFLSGCSYERVDDEGLHLRIDGRPQPPLAVDHVVVCAGQEPEDALAGELVRRGVRVDCIGGARVATGLDAMRAIDEGTRLAYRM
jgi:2,4-dienoyl-CoA reductase (NADPH2)